jgi:hypothetical protein
MNNLPQDILFNIFTYLHNSNDILNYLCLSRKFYGILNLNSITIKYKNYLKSEEYKLQYLKDLLSRLCNKSTKITSPSELITFINYMDVNNNILFNMQKHLSKTNNQSLLLEFHNMFFVLLNIYKLKYKHQYTQFKCRYFHGYNIINNTWILCRDKCTHKDKFINIYI